MVEAQTPQAATVTIKPWEKPFTDKLPTEQEQTLRKAWDEEGGLRESAQKDANVHALYEKMLGDKDLTRFSEEFYLGAGRYDVPELNAIDGLIGKWAYSSADEDPLALVLQRAVQEEFDLKDLRDPMESVYRRSTRAGVDWWLETGYMPLFRRFVRAEYELTQDWLRRNGITHIKLYRGYGWYPPRGDVIPRQLALLFNSFERTSRLEDVVIEGRLQPASSFSFVREVAELTFARDDYSMVEEAVVPAERILSTARTGRGCLFEREFIVLGGSGVRTTATLMKETDELL